MKHFSPFLTLFLVTELASRGHMAPVSPYGYASVLWPAQPFLWDPCLAKDA